MLVNHYLAIPSLCAAVGIVIYYIVICLYLYGDLAIYLVAIPKSIVTVVWYVPTNSSTRVLHPLSF